MVNCDVRQLDAEPDHTQRSQSVLSGLLWY